MAGILPASGGTPEVVRLENTERAIRRFVEKLGGPEGLAVCYENLLTFPWVVSPE